MLSLSCVSYNFYAFYVPHPFAHPNISFFKPLLPISIRHPPLYREPTISFPRPLYLYTYSLCSLTTSLSLAFLSFAIPSIYPTLHTYVYPRLSLYLPFALYPTTLLHTLPFCLLPPCIFPCLPSLLYTYHSFLYFLFILSPLLPVLSNHSSFSFFILLPISPLSYILYTHPFLSASCFPSDAFLSFFPILSLF